MFGFPIRLHWTLPAATGLLLLIDTGLPEKMAMGILILGIAISILLHEVAHAVMARKRGIHVDMILLTPLGGVAIGEGMAQDPPSEMRIAFAGPAVSLMLGSILLGASYLLHLEHDIIGLLGIVNMAIGAFNLLPAFPLDGGRVLRALLARKLPLVSATRWAVGTSRAISLAMIASGLYFHQLWLGLIGLFLYFAGRAELASVRFRVFIASRTAEDVMVETDHTLAAGTPIHEAIAYAKATTQEIFPVCFGEKMLGIISTDEMFRAMEHGDGDAGVSLQMTRHFVIAEPAEPLESLLRRMADERTPSAMVLSDGIPVGIVAMDDVFRNHV